MSKYRRLIDEFEAGGQRLRAAVTGLTREEALARTEPGKWSSQELVIHLADSDAIAIDRMKRLIAEDNPTFLRADEQAYVDRLHCDAQSLEDAVLLFDLNRRQFARVLRRLSDSEFQRAGTHNAELGRITLAELLENYSDHLDHHLKFLKGKRAALKAGVTRTDT
ncbi:MAG: DinB family protein [Planctomycetota bacterium]|jgi:hypothetical protein